MNLVLLIVQYFLVLCIAIILAGMIISILAFAIEQIVLFLSWLWSSIAGRKR